MLRALSLFVIVAIAATLACGASAASGPLRTAVAEDVEFEGRDADLALRRVRAAGATAVRVEMRWSRIAPGPQASGAPPRFDATNPADPLYRWQQVDEKLKRLERHGLEAILTIYTAPQWARMEAFVANSPPFGFDIYNFMLAAARRYSGRFEDLPRVRYWQVWIEPNVNTFFTPQFVSGRPVSPSRYRNIVERVAEAVHAVHRDNLVVAGGLAPFTVQRGLVRTIGPLRFMREMLCMSAGRRPRPTCNERVHFDIWAHHPYTSGDPTHQAFNADDVSLGDLPEMRRLLDAAIKARHVLSNRRVEFWVTEFGWDTDPPDRGAVPLRLQARWTSEALYRMWANGVSLVTWLKLRDDAPSGHAQAGLWFRGGARLTSDRPKPTLTAFRFPFVALPQRGRVFVWGRAPAGRAASVIVEQTFRGGWRRAARLRSNRFGIFSARLRLPQVGSLRARLVPGGAAGSGVSLAFSLKRPPDRFVRIFG